MGYIVILQNTPLKRDRACSVNIISFLPQPPFKEEGVGGREIVPVIHNFFYSH